MPRLRGWTRFFLPALNEYDGHHLEILHPLIICHVTDEYQQDNILFWMIVASAILRKNLFNKNILA